MNPTTALREGHRAATVPALALVLNAFVWGVSWWPFRRLESAGLHPLWATALIYAVAVIAISAALGVDPNILVHDGRLVLLASTLSTRLGSSTTPLRMPSFAK